MEDSQKRVYSYDPMSGFMPLTQEKEAPVVSRNTVENQIDTENEPPRVTTNTVSEEAVENEENVDEGQEFPEVKDGEVKPGIEEESQPVVEGSETEEVDDSPQSDEEDVAEKHKPTETPVTDNFFIAAAERMKSSGMLPEDFSISEDVSDEEADSLIFENYLKKLRPEAHKELLSEFQEEISKRGYTETTLQYANMLEHGISDSDIRAVTNYKALANIKDDELSDDEKKELIERMYIDRNWKKTEIKRALESAEIDDEIDELVNESKDYFKSRATDYEKELRSMAEQNALQREKILQYNQSVVAHVFNKKEIGGEKLTDEELDVFEDAIFSKNIPVQYGDKIYNVSAFDQFESALNSDFALRVWAFKKWVFRESEKNKYLSEAQRKADENKVIKWGKGVKKSSSNQNKDSNKGTPIQGSRTGGSSYILDGGDFKKIPK